jgi:hypothetical protein
MAREYSLPDEAERKSFVEKLRQFRQSLPASEQQMLDIMAATTFAPQSQEDVHGYEWFWGIGGPAGSGWYYNGWRPGWDNTPYQNTAYNMNAQPDGRYLP